MIEVLKPGLYSTIQDSGRIGYREFGVPVSGFMDAFSASLANSILNNDLNSSVLEMTLVGTKLCFKVATQICISGALITAKLNNTPIQYNSVITVSKNDILSFGNVRSGVYTYLAVKDGFKTATVMNSRSYYEGITKKSKIEKGDILMINEVANKDSSSTRTAKIKPQDFTSNTITVFEGPEFDLLSNTQKVQLFDRDFTVSKLYNRMAYQLSPSLEHQLPSILTSPVLPGTVQLTPSGKLIVLMRDCQTTGGYPRVLQLSEQGINLLSQKKERDVVKFKLS